VDDRHKSILPNASHELLEFAADFVAALVASFFKNSHGLLPGMPGELRLAISLESVAKVIQDHGFVEPVTHEAEEGPRLLVAGHRLG
jgi:hypothetical protein